MPFPLRFVQNTTQREKVLSQFLRLSFISCPAQPSFNFYTTENKRRLCLLIENAIKKAETTVDHINHSLGFFVF
jgi:hypothetical protein